MLERPKVLLLSTDRTETAVLQQALGEYATITLVCGLPDLRCLLDSECFDALFCAWSFPTGTWHDVLSEIHQGCPVLPVIIFSRHAAEKEWIEVLEAGAFDLLAMPPREERELLAVLEQASESCKARTSRATPRAFEHGHGHKHLRTH